MPSVKRSDPTFNTCTRTEQRRPRAPTAHEELRVMGLLCLEDGVEQQPKACHGPGAWRLSQFSTVSGFQDVR
jgi:hypothetical protein